MRGPNPRSTLRARSLRQVDNDAENKLWTELRNRRLNGLKFVRQFPIGPYFADFACRENHLVVEWDGSQHINSAHDAQRDAFMNTSGWSVVRFWNADALTDMPSLLKRSSLFAMAGWSSAWTRQICDFSPHSKNSSSPHKPGEEVQWRSATEKHSEIWNVPSR